MRLHDATIAASRGKVWWYRIPLLIPLAWIFCQHLADSEYGSLFAGINLAVHEGGHLFFTWFGSDFVTVAGGTFLQCICPILTGIMFYRQRDFFAIGVACFWLGTNFAHIAPYAADARAQLLPLVSTFQGAPGHDWNYLLGTLGLLGRDRAIGALSGLPASLRWEGAFLAACGCSGSWRHRMWLTSASSRSSTAQVNRAPRTATLAGVVAARQG